MTENIYFPHSSSFIDQPYEIGEGTRIWHFCHIMPNAKIGKHCSLGQNVMHCPESGWSYKEEDRILHCLDWSEYLPL